MQRSRHCFSLFVMGFCVLSGAIFLSAAEIHVSPRGSDTGDGTADHPFASVHRGQEAARALRTRSGLNEPVIVLIAAGHYELGRPLVFTPADSGTAACPVTYRGVGVSRPILSGGRRVEGFRREGDLWVATIEGAKAGRWTFIQLYVNGRRRPRARTPNEGSYFRVRSALSGNKASRRGFRYAEGTVQDWDDIAQAVFVVYGSWYNTIHHVESLDTENRIVHFTNSAGRPFDWYEGALRYYVENIAVALDAPGEWHLDTDSGRLSYFPLPGEKLEDLEVVAPVVSQTLVRFEGKPGTGPYVEHVRLENLSLEHTDAHFPSDLYDARQAATVQDAGILADGARHCRIERCTVAHMGAHGIWFRDDCQHNRVRQCHVHDLGGGGVYIGEKWRWGGGCPGWAGYRNFADIPHVTEHNVVDNCFIHDGCHLFTGAIGVWVGQASHTTVSHNEICDMTYSGVSLGWDWSGHKSTSHHNIIEFNHIHHLGHARMNDMAGVYTLGLSPGSIIRNNLIHDIQAYQSPGGYCLGGGIYLDQSSGDLTVRDNVCHTISNTGFFLHHGTRNRILNNVFAEIAGLGRIGWSLYFSSRLAAADSGNEAVGNIVYGASPKTAKATQAAARGKKKGTPYDFVAADRNVYWATGEVPLTFSDRADDAPEKLLDFAAWRKTGHDGASLVVDPMFEDPAAHDYRLRAESPARALGISSIDVSKAGLYGDAKWRDLPRGVVFRKLDSAVPFLPEKLLFIDEDYEGDKPGTVPPGAKYENRQKGAVIEVTDALAADGRKCLKFADAPGLPASYHPARTWGSLQVHTGTVRLSFDVLNSAERPATLWIEMRDWRKMPYKVGPTLTFRPDGMLELGDGRELPYAHGVWHHVQIILQLGEDAPDSFQMTFGPKGERKAEMTVAFKHKDFEVLTWLGFVAADEDRQSEAYIDNLKLTMD